MSPTPRDHPADQDDIEELKAADAKDVHRAVREEGEAELDRPASSLFWSGLAAGIAINASLIAEGVLEATLPASAGKPLLVALGYPIGFVIVILGRMQFFTESTITAMLPLATSPSGRALGRTFRLWAIVLAANLVGTALTTAALTTLHLVDADVVEGMSAVSRSLLSHDALAVFCTAIPAGFLIASVAWLLPNGREQAFLVIFAITWLVGVAGLSHSVVGSAEAFMLTWRGDVGIGEAFARFIMPAVAGNLVGGAGLFALIAHGQVREEMTKGDAA